MSIERRDFIKGGLAAALMPASSALAAEKKPEIWAGLLHIGQNMWSDIPVKEWLSYPTKEELANVCGADHVRCDEAVWAAATGHMAATGMNMIIVDLAEALYYPSHPELAVKGTWSVEKMRAELARLRKLGLEPIPKLNFSTAHDLWLGDYERMVSSKVYYKVCADLIRDVWEIFDRPRFFHFGWDEESAGGQAMYSYSVVRQADLWWHDLLFFIDTIKGLGMRPWMWGDCYKDEAKCQEFIRRIPKDVVISHWYYSDEFENLKPKTARHIDWFRRLGEAGYDQLPTGSNFVKDGNMAGLVKFCTRTVPSASLKGFMMAPWWPTHERYRERLLKAFDLTAAARKEFA